MVTGPTANCGLLLTELDFALVQSLLQAALHNHLKDTTTAPDVRCNAAEADKLRVVCDSVLSTVRQCVQDAANAGMRDTEATDVEQRSGRSDGGVDAELLQLHEQVQQASARVSELRQRVPLAMADAAARQMAALRPALELHTAPGALPGLGGRPAANTAGETVSSTNAESNTTDALEEVEPDANVWHIANVFAAEVDRLPGLRARLDQTTQRLSRIVGAIEDDKVRASPRTVERVMMGVRTPLVVHSDGPTNPGAAAGMSFADSVSGTRRHLLASLQAV